MSDKFYFIWIITLALLSIIYLLIMPFIDTRLKIKKISVSNKDAKAALDKISQWTIWITSLQTGAIASMAFLIKDKCGRLISIDQKHFAFFTILFFGGSIMLSAWVLSAIPSIIQRMKNKNNSTKNDIFEISIYSFVPFRFGHLTALVHWYFAFGIMFFSLFIYSFIK